MTRITDQQLVKRLRAGDRGVLAELLEQHHQRLYNICLRMLNHRDDALEVTQQAMLSIIRHAGEFRGESAATTWMTRILMNHALSHLRRQRVRHTASLDTGPDDQDQATSLRNQLADTREPNPAWRVENDEMLQYLRQAIAQLDGSFRSVLVLRDIDQLDYPQIAAVLDLPLGTVKSRLFRARLALRQQMQHLIDHPHPHPHGHDHRGPDAHGHETGEGG